MREDAEAISSWETPQDTLLHPLMFEPQKPKSSVYYSYIYLKCNHVTAPSVDGLALVHPEKKKKKEFVDSVCWDLTNQYDYLCSRCSCVCTTKTPICVWDIVRDERMKNKWMRGKNKWMRGGSLIYCRILLYFKYLVRNKRKQWKEQRLNKRECLVVSWHERGE